MGNLMLTPTFKSEVGKGGEVRTKTYPHHPPSPCKGVGVGGWWRRCESEVGGKVGGHGQCLGWRFWTPSPSM